MRGPGRTWAGLGAAVGALGAAAGLLMAAGGAGDEGPAPPELKVGRASGPISIDGRLDEPAWERAASLKLVAADGKKPAGAPTEVKVAYDDRDLYLAFVSTDPDIWTDHKGRDSHMWTEDVVEAFIDIDPSEPGYVELEVSPLGDLFDGLFLERHRRVLMGWNPDIRVRVAVDGTVNRRDDRDRSWTVEMAIPVGDLAPSPGVGRPGAEIRKGTAWRMNFYRNERSGETKELEAWAPVRGDFHETSLFGRVVFE